MGTTVTSTERVRTSRIGVGGLPPGNKGPKGNGPGGNGGKRKDEAAQRFSPKPYRLTLWIILAAIFMMFTALVAAYIMLSSGEAWQPMAMPHILWLSTGLIIVSSFSFEAARRSLKQGDDGGYTRWLLVTSGLGLGFLVSQLLAWRQLVSQGAYLAKNPHSSFFYLFTGAHGLHLLGGILALSYLLLRRRLRQQEANASMKRQAIAGAVSLYWHFMDGLWIFLFLLLLLWN